MASPSRMVSARHLGALLDAAVDKGLVGCVDLFIENLQRGVPARYGGIGSAAFSSPRRVDNFENIGQIENDRTGRLKRAGCVLRHVANIAAQRRSAPASVPSNVA